MCSYGRFVTLIQPMHACSCCSGHCGCACWLPLRPPSLIVLCAHAADGRIRLRPCVVWQAEHGSSLACAWACLQRAGQHPRYRPER